MAYLILHLEMGTEQHIRNPDSTMDEMVEMSDNLVHLEGGEEEGTIIKVVEEVV
jgi:hypothetical protein